MATETKRRSRIGLILTAIIGLLVLPALSQSISAATGQIATGTVAPHQIVMSSPTASMQNSGERIAFVSDRNGHNEIYVMNADGSNLVNLTNNPSEDYAPAWSPDGTHIVFQSQRDGNWGIYVMDANGSGVVNLTNRNDALPAWSPDGKHIAFTSDRDGKSEIYVMNADGSNQRRLTDAPEADSDFGPAWSPDAERIAFVRHTITYQPGGLSGSESETWEIYVMNADGSDPVRLTYDHGNDESPAWSPDGKHIAFDSDRAGNQEVYVMNADGSNPVRLTNNSNPAISFSPAWSPDGKHIAFTSYRDANDEIYVMNADGSNAVRLTNNPADDQHPAIGP